MPIVTNGDFSNGLTGWTVSGAGPTSPTHDPVNNRVIFGGGNNDVRDGDRIEQVVALEAGQEYTLTFSASELGSTFGGFGLNVELVDANNTTNTQFLQFVTITNDETTSVSVTFTSNFDDPVLRIRGAYGFGGVNSMLILDDIAISCFTAGCRLRTDRGDIEVEKLVAGDLLITHPSGNQTACAALPIVRIFTRTVTSYSIRRNPKLRPIRITAGALGLGLPKRDLLVSRQHRMLVQSKIAERMFGSLEVLIPAIKLTTLPGIFVDENVEEVDYLHVLLDRHEVIFAESAPTESLFAGPEALKSIGPEANEEILTIFPELVGMRVFPKSARYIPPPKLQKKLIERHLKNKKPVQFT